MRTGPMLSSRMRRSSILTDRTDLHTTGTTREENRGSCHNGELDEDPSWCGGLSPRAESQSCSSWKACRTPKITCVCWSNICAARSATAAMSNGNCETLNSQFVITSRTFLCEYLDISRFFESRRYVCATYGFWFTASLREGS